MNVLSDAMTFVAGLDKSSLASLKDDPSLVGLCVRARMAHGDEWRQLLTLCPLGSVPRRPGTPSGKVSKVCEACKVPMQAYKNTRFCESCFKEQAKVRAQREVEASRRAAEMINSWT